MADPLTTVTWVEGAPTGLPPLTDDLDGWTIDRRRQSHINGHREVHGEVFYLKWFLHGPARRPAEREWENAAALAALGIPSVDAAGWGRHRQGSFVVLRRTPGQQADHWWHENHRERQATSLTRELARLVAALHDASLCHRDLNVYHVFVDGDALALIDVGRVFRFRSWRAERWIVKDLAGLLYSARRQGFPPRLERRFLIDYLRHTRRGLRRERLLRRIEAKARRYQRHNEKKEARGEIP